MKKLLDTMMLAVGLLFPATLAAEALPLIQNVNAYESMSLNGEWNYIVDVQEEGYYDYRMKPMRNGFFISMVSGITLSMYRKRATTTIV